MRVSAPLGAVLRGNDGVKQGSKSKPRATPAQSGNRPIAQTHTAEIAIIGGGPGGSAAAASLARRGRRVVLLERERFPRDHVGESLLPASIPVLRELGVLDRVEREGFPKKYGATMLWGKRREPWSWRFEETNRTYPHAYQVWRPTFDAILLDNARESGVDVREGCSATAPILEGGDNGDADRVRGVAYRDSDGRERTLEADWVVDASGQASVVGRAMGLRRWDDYFRNMALYAYYEGGRRLPGADAGNIFIESCEHGWTWHIPLRNGGASVGAVVDSERGRRDIAEFGVAGCYERRIGAASITRDMLAGARMTRQPSVVRDWSYTSERMVGDGWLLVGDAACFVDPLFSSGVHLALMAAMMAAAYIDAAHRDDTLRLPAARVYERVYRAEYSHFRELARLFYASNRAVESYFWEARRLLGESEDADARAAFIRAVAGQSPRGYERAVLDSGSVPDETRAAIAGVESARRERAAAFDRADLMSAVPALSANARIERRPIFADGEFQWSRVLVTDDRPEGVPVSPLVAALASKIDGRASASEIMADMARGIESPRERAMAAQAVAATLRILAAEGVATLREIGE